MSRESVEVVREMYEAYVAGDGERALAYFHPDGQVDFTQRLDVNVATGRREIAEVVGSWLASWDDYSEEIKEIRDLGNHRVLVAVTQRGRGKGSAVEVSSHAAFLIEVRDGLIFRMAGYLDLDSALAAAGVSNED
jgi:ketosteroid isomerase-like protein